MFSCFIKMFADDRVLITIFPGYCFGKDVEGNTLRIISKGLAKRNQDCSHHLFSDYIHVKNWVARTQVR